MTRAPMSASMSVQYGPDITRVRSSTVTLESTSAAIGRSYSHLAQPFT